MKRNIMDVVKMQKIILNRTDILDAIWKRTIFMFDELWQHKIVYMKWNEGREQAIQRKK
jgi:hypothetical protein